MTPKVVRPAAVASAHGHAGRGMLTWWSMRAVRVALVAYHRVMRRASILVVVIAAVLGCSRVQPVTREDVSLSIGTTYDQWLYQGTAGGRHRFLVRSVRLVGVREEVDEREVSLAVDELPLLATTVPTTDRARWVEFFSRADGARPVSDGMRVARIRRSFDFIPAPYGSADVPAPRATGSAAERSR